MAQQIGCPFPIGAIYITVDPTNPSTLRPGTWRVPFGNGEKVDGVAKPCRAIVCCSTDKDSAYHNPETEITVAHTHTLATGSVNEGEEGSSTVVVGTDGTGGKVTGATVGYAPSITAYIRKRVADYEHDISKSEKFFNPYGIEQGDIFGHTSIIDKETLKPVKRNPYDPTNPQ